MPLVPAQCRHLTAPAGASSPRRSHLAVSSTKWPGSREILITTSAFAWDFVAAGSCPGLEIDSFDNCRSNRVLIVVGILDDHFVEDSDDGYC